MSTTPTLGKRLSTDEVMGMAQAEAVDMGISNQAPQMLSRGAAGGGGAAQTGGQPPYVAAPPAPPASPTFRGGMQAYPMQPVGVMVGVGDEDPLLDALDHELGIKKIDPITVDAGGHKWTLRPLFYDDQLWTLKNVDTTSFGSKAKTDDESVEDLEPDDPEPGMILAKRTVAMALAAIDGKPVTQLFGMRTVPGDPMDPPAPWRFLAAEKLLDKLSRKWAPQLVHKLAAAQAQIQKRMVLHDLPLDEPQKPPSTAP